MPATPAQRDLVRRMTAQGRLRIGRGATVEDGFSGQITNPENYMVNSRLDTLSYAPALRRTQSPEQVALQNWLKMVAQLPNRQREAVQHVRRLWTDPRVPAFLDVISAAEGARYNSLVGDNVPGQRVFTDFSTHPEYGGVLHKGRRNSNAARYQIGLPLRSDRVRDLGMPDMSALTQDAMATETIRRIDVIDALRRGDLVGAFDRAASTWTSFPAGSEPRLSRAELEAEYHRRRAFHTNRLASRR